MIIYRLISPSGKSYIGKTKFSLELRLKQHIQLYKLKKERDKNYQGCPTKLFYAFDKYGFENFKEEILYECDNLVELNEKEQYFIKIFDTITQGYNITKGGDGRIVNYLESQHKENISRSRIEYWNTNQGKEWKIELSKMLKENNPGKHRRNYSHSKETIEKIRKAKTGQKLTHTKPRAEEHNKKIGDANRGKIRSSELKKRWSDMRKGIPLDPKIHEAAKKALSKTWEITFPDGHTEIIVNLNQFCRDYNLDSCNLIGTQPGGRSKKHKGYSCKKIEITQSPKYDQ